MPRGRPKGFKCSEETKAKMSAAQKAAHNRPETKKKRRIANARPDVKKRKSAALKEAFARPEVRARIKAAANRIDVKNRRIKHTLQARKKNGSLKKTKPEIQLEELLNQILPNEYKFTGHGDFVLAGKCPDFVNINGQKKIIEMIGSDDFYENHTTTTLAERVKLFRTYGYETLLIYDYELNNIKTLKTKILNFAAA